MTKPIHPAKPDVDDELRPPTPQETEYLRRQQDPYAKLSVTLREPTEHQVGSNTATTNNQTCSRKDFEFEARRILGFYVPGVKKSVLPLHYREFIARNANRDGTQRLKVLQQLRRYDLRDVVGINTYFNREKEELTEAKLREIEIAAGIKD